MRPAASNIDELQKMIEEDELGDATVVLECMTVNDYARARGIAPQRVYYYVRNNRLEKTRCACGRSVINIERADAVLGFKKEVEENDDGGSGT